jgi:hypothetical protein
VRLRRAHVPHGRGCPSGHERPAWVATDNARIRGSKVLGRRLRSSSSWALSAATVVYPAHRRSQVPSEEGHGGHCGALTKQAESARKQPNTTEHRHHLSVRLSVSDTRHA